MYSIRRICRKCDFIIGKSWISPHFSPLCLSTGYYVCILQLLFPLRVVLSLVGDIPVLLTFRCLPVFGNDWYVHMTFNIYFIINIIQNQSECLKYYYTFWIRRRIRHSVEILNVLVRPRVAIFSGAISKPRSGQGRAQDGESREPNGTWCDHSDVMVR